jgi:hypothetical protein
MEKLLRTDKQKKDFEKWIKALRSGEYKQSKNALQSNQGFCCLGVACDVIISQDKKQLSSDKNLSGGVPEHQKNSPRWLSKINMNIASKFGVPLTQLNDYYKYSFDDIADVLTFFYENDML